MNESDCAHISFNIFYDTFNRHGLGGACKTRNTQGAEHGDARGIGVRPHIRFPSARANVPRDVARHRGGQPHGQIYVGGSSPIMRS